MPDHTYLVEWEVASDEAMSDVVRKGRSRAQKQHTATRCTSTSGPATRPRVLVSLRVGDPRVPRRPHPHHPAADARPAALVFGLVSCQRYNAGFYTAYDDLVAADPDLVVHVGDYIYEITRWRGPHRPAPGVDHARPVPEPRTPSTRAMRR